MRNQVKNENEHQMKDGQKSFKCQSFIEAANIVNNKFPPACIDTNNVENPMCTLSKIIMTLKN